MSVLFSHSGYNQRTECYPELIKTRKKYGACHAMGAFKHIDNLE